MSTLSDYGYLKFNALASISEQVIESPRKATGSRRSLARAARLLLLRLGRRVKSAHQCPIEPPSTKRRPDERSYDRSPIRGLY